MSRKAVAELTLVKRADLKHKSLLKRSEQFAQHWRLLKAMEKKMPDLPSTGDFA